MCAQDQHVRVAKYDEAAKTLYEHHQRTHHDRNEFIVGGDRMLHLAVRARLRAHHLARLVRLAGLVDPLAAVLAHLRRTWWRNRLRAKTLVRNQGHMNVRWSTLVVPRGDDAVLRTHS